VSTQEFNKGDKVTWRSHGSTAEGTVEEKITTDKTAAKRKVWASEDDPQYRVRSDRSGNDAVHKPAALTPRLKAVVRCVPASATAQIGALP
jgi:hypothetical protein